MKRILVLVALMLVLSCSSPRPVQSAPVCDGNIWSPCDIAEDVAPVPASWVGK